MEEIIKPILEQNPKARVDDMYLYAIYCKKQVNYDTIDMEQVFMSSEYRISRGIRTFSAVERCRRRIQEKYESLKIEQFEEIKNKEQKTYIEYSLT